MTQTRIGISGWKYDSWKGTFYPDDLPMARQLEYASRCFNSIEINSSFYSLKTPETYRRWYDATPAGFVFAVKGSQFITHNKRLKDIDAALANFFASGVLLLKEKLGPFLWQLPARTRFDGDRIASFLETLPRDTHAAARLARRHDYRVKGRSWTRPDRKRLLRHALEVRHESFFNDDFVRLMRRHNVAIVFSDSADWPYVEELTAGFLYARLHGHGKTYESRYGKALEGWARRLRKWREGREPGDPERITDRKPPRRKHRDLYVYFDNDKKVYAPDDAENLARLLGAEPPAEGCGE